MPLIRPPPTQDAIGQFLRTKTCYDCMPKSGNVVVFDANMNLRLVLAALADHDAAPLWHPLQQRVVGLVARSDLADIAWHARDYNGELDDILDAHTAMSWRALCRNAGHAPADAKGARTAAKLMQSPRARPALGGFAMTGPDASLWQAVRQMRKAGVHHLPVVDDAEQTTYFVVTLRRVFDFLTLHFADDRRIFDQQLRELGIGSHGGVVSVAHDAVLADVMALFEDTPALSALPVRDGEGRLVNVFRRSAAFACTDFSAPLASLLDRRALMLHTAPPDVTLFQAFVKFAETKAHGLYLVTPAGALAGLVTLAQVLDYFCAADAE